MQEVKDLLGLSNLTRNARTERFYKTGFYLGHNPMRENFKAIIITLTHPENCSGSFYLLMTARKSERGENVILTEKIRHVPREGISHTSYLCAATLPGEPNKM